MKAKITLFLIFFSFAATGIARAHHEAPAGIPPSSIENQGNYPAKLPIQIIFVKNDGCAPMTITIRRGVTLRWINKDAESHTFTGFGISKELAPGETLDHRFDDTGTYPYRCSEEGSLGGVVVVIPGN